MFAQLRWAEFWHNLVSAEVNMSLYYVLLRGWVQISDYGWFVRLLSVLAGVVTVPAVYFVGKAVCSHRAGTIAALLLAVNVFHVTFSQEARSYSLVVLLVTCSCLFFLQVMKKPQRGSEALYILTSAAALYAHFFAALVLAASVILVGQGLAEISWTWVRRATVTIVVLGSIWAFRTYYRQPPQEDWKSATRFLIQNAQPGDVVFFPRAYFINRFGLMVGTYG